jgi:hypothetical protein
MDINEKALLLEALQTGQVTVTFKKIDTGELRVMPCTLEPKALEKAGVTNKVNYGATQMEAFPVWSLDKNAWRSFRLDTVVQWDTNSPGLSRREKVLLDPPKYRVVDDAGVDLETGKMV